MSQKPLMLGINRAKRLAKSMDERDRRLVLQKLGAGFPKRSDNHQTLVKSRLQAARLRGV
jgi:hypothetical protein